jgi:hypothetical protein
MLILCSPYQHHNVYKEISGNTTSPLISKIVICYNVERVVRGPSVIKNIEETRTLNVFCFVLQRKRKFQQDRDCYTVELQNNSFCKTFLRYKEIGSRKKIPNVSCALQ